jgi:hypothetical protein
MLLVAAVLLCSAVPTLQQDKAADSDSKSKGSATEAPFASGAKSEADDGSAAAVADKAASAQTPPAAPAPKAASKTAKKSKIVEIAPEAELQNDVDDIDVTGGEHLAWLAMVLSKHTTQHMLPALC